MQSFDIIKKSELENTYRVKAIKDTYDLQIDQTNERFVGSINLDKDWKVGLIVGNSGTGKSTIAKKSPPFTYEALGRKNIGISVSMFFILKIVLRFFDKLFFFAFFVVWKF